MKPRVPNIILKRLTSQASAWRTTIGLEVHAQIASNTKLFSSAETSFAAPINSNVNLLDAAVPGTLPVINEKCVHLAVLSSLALSCSINNVSHFDRKHYFYADLPCGYQITQQTSPIASNGIIEFYVYTPGIHKCPYKRSCRIKQIQLEQDSGKSLHDIENRKSLIDLNRAGTGLMEFVFEAELNDGEEAAALVKELMLILERLKSCSCKMEEGALRVDANVSVSKDPDKLGVRTEIKNIGSVRGVANAIKFESERQISVLKKGGFIVNETRNWDPDRKETISMRDKEEKQDYRFMPEPNLPPLRVCVDESISEVADGTLDLRRSVRTLPELPATSRLHLVEKFGFSDIYAIMIVNQPNLFDHFSFLMKEDSKRDAKLVWNVLMVQLLNVLNSNDFSLDSCSLDNLCLGDIIDLLQSEKINLETARNIMELKLKHSMLTPLEIMKENNWQLVSDPIRIEAICNEVIERNPKAIKKYQKGKTKALQTVVNDVANITTDKINLSMVSKRIKEILQTRDKPS